MVVLNSLLFRVSGSSALRGCLTAVATAGGSRLRFRTGLVVVVLVMVILGSLQQCMCMLAGLHAAEGERREEEG